MTTETTAACTYFPLYAGAQDAADIAWREAWEAAEAVEAKGGPPASTVAGGPQGTAARAARYARGAYYQISDEQLRRRLSGVRTTVRMGTEHECADLAEAASREAAILLRRDAEVQS